MMLLDTDHLTVLTFREHSAYSVLCARLDAQADQEFVTSIITVEELMRGWMAVINRQRKAHDQTHAYSRLGQLFDFFSDWVIIPFDDRAADEFEKLRCGRIRIGTMD
jgi:tRNA(fMet)-specific endonuclease VapC